MADPLEGLLLDIDGVLTLSWREIPGAADALRRIREAGVPFVLVTNTTTHSRDRLAEQLRRAGIDVGPGEILTAAAATARYVRAHHPDASVYLVAADDTAAEFDGVRLVDADADVVVIGGITEDEGFAYDELNRAFGMVMQGAPLVAMHRLAWWMTESGPRLDTPVILPGIESAAATTATVVGKPSPEFFGEAVDVLGLPAPAVAMVGDDLVTDVRGAQAVGMAGILVRTGKFREADLAGPGRRPDAVLDSIADVPRLLETLTTD